MDHGFQFICRTKTKRLIWLSGIIFIAVILIQYFELPYGSVLSSLLPAGKVSFIGRSYSSGGDSLSNSEKKNGSLIGDFGLFSNGTSTESSLEGSSSSTSENVGSSVSSPAPEKARETEHRISSNNASENNNSNKQIELSSFQQNASSGSGHGSGFFALPPTISSHGIVPPTNSENSIAPVTYVERNTSSAKDANASDPLAVNDTTKIPVHPVISISEMNKLLLRSRSSPHSVTFRPQSLSKVDQELLYAKSQIENAPVLKNDSELYGPLYRNISMFKRSYELMEQTLKVYIYKEGETPVFHQPMLKGIYASEGWFMKLMKANKQHVTENPEKAHLFYLPFSVRMLVGTLYVPNSHSDSNLVQYLKNYIDMIVARYPFWNRTGGADHFLVACHDWGPSETKEHMPNCIRALCNANINEGFRFEKDVSLPATLVSSPKDPLRQLGGNPASERPILAFFAGKMHGYLRPVLLHYWGNEDPEMKIFGKLPKVKGNKEYINYMRTSKYCICARGYEVSSPRVVEAIFYECVPVVISDNFVPPFFEVLNWETFAVFVRETDIPNLKNILLSISEERYVLMQQRVKQVQQHFLWHADPVKYDIFNMILHSIWYKKVSQINPS